MTGGLAVQADAPSAHLTSDSDEIFWTKKNVARFRTTFSLIP
jgi:hypothetical protein